MTSSLDVFLPTSTPRQKRQRIEVKGLTHRDPLPNGVRMGDYVFSSVIVPWDLSTSEPVVGEPAQTDQCFDNMRIFMEQAGGSVDDVALQWVYLNDFGYRPFPETQMAAVETLAAEIEDGLAGADGHEGERADSGLPVVALDGVVDLHAESSFLTIEFHQRNSATIAPPYHRRRLPSLGLWS